MVSLETIPSTSNSIDPSLSPRISFSADFLAENNFISIDPNSHIENEQETAHGLEFEFLGSNLTSQTMITADELFSEGKLLPCWKIQHYEKPEKISLKKECPEKGEVEEEANKAENRVNWFADDDPSPRLPTCTVLWKELLRLKKQRAASMSSFSPSSSLPSSGSLADLAPFNEAKEGSGNKEKQVKRIRKGLERTRSGSIKIRPMINVPICTQGKSGALPPSHALTKGRI